MFNILFRKLANYEIMCEKKYGRPGHATDDNMVHAHCTLDT